MKYSCALLFAIITALQLSCGNGLSSLTVNTRPGCKLESVNEGGNCGCDLLLPVDTSKLTGTNLFWPFGAHGGGHPEGHRGWDFLSNTSQDIIAPDDGVVVDFQTDSKAEDPDGMSVYLKLTCNIVVSFQPMRPDASLAIGVHVKRGQRLGTTSPIVFGGYSTHFDTRVSASMSQDSITCPQPFFNTDRLNLVSMLLSQAGYNEKVAHTFQQSCSNGTTQSFSFPAESAVCNGRASAANNAALAGCLSASTLSNSGIW